MEANQIIILSAVLFVIIAFVIYFIVIIKRGRKNISKINPRVVKIEEGRFIPYDDLNEAAFDLLDDVAELELNDKHYSYTPTKLRIYIEYEKTKQLTNKF